MALQHGKAQRIGVSRYIAAPPVRSKKTFMPTPRSFCLSSAKTSIIRPHTNNSRNISTAELPADRSGTYW
ncbi:hypothetical protein [Ruminococcus bicirculans (ex Wegman et al. 2014)]|uniref:hypothetical protein n=1 Tax=Ruminococcus bicirculans (ex Wegman et al. 2014) TaxID=1160721 RepID=UPI004025E0C6